MRATFLTGISALLAFTAASPVGKVTLLDTLVKRTFAAEIAPQLSSGASVIFPQDNQWSEITVRWSNHLAPTFQAAVRVASEADVITVVKYATAHGIQFFTQAGGHGFAPLSTARDAIMIQMGQLNSITIDPGTGIATVGGGVEYYGFINTLYAAGREYPVGTCPCVGMTGAGLGGGIGRLQGLHGLAVDAFRRYRVVLASGQVINVTRTENADLFWGMRGAGQNFGVVIQSDVQTYPATNNGMNYNVDLVLSDDKLEAGLRLVNQQMLTMPPEMAMEPTFAVNSTTLEPFFTVNIVFAGNETAARRWLDPWRALGPSSFVESNISWNNLPTETQGGAKTAGCATGGFKNIYSTNLRWLHIPTMRRIYNSLGGFVRENPGANNTVILFEVYGQQGVRARRVEDSAVGGRNHMAILPLIFSWWYDPALTSRVDTYLAGVRNQMRRVSGYGRPYVYQNYARDEPVQQYYGYEPWRVRQLQNLKRKYDPTNQFFAYHPVPA